MIKFSSIVDSETYDKIKSGDKCIKFFLCDEKRENLSVGDVFQLQNKNGSSFLVQVVNIQKSKELKKLVKTFPLQLLGELDYNRAYENIKKWFSNEDIKRFMIMAVEIRVKDE